MAHIGDPIAGLAWVINTVLTLYVWIVIAGALLSWINPDPFNPIVRFIKGLTQPVYRFMHRNLPFTLVGGIDLSPIVVIFAIHILKAVVVNSLLH